MLLLVCLFFFSSVHSVHPAGMGMEMFATLAGATIQGQIVGVYHAKKAQACNELNETNALPENYSFVLYHNSTSLFTDTLHATVRYHS